MPGAVCDVAGTGEVLPGEEPDAWPEPEVVAGAVCGVPEPCLEEGAGEAAGGVAGVVAGAVGADCGEVGCVVDGAPGVFVGEVPGAVVGADPVPPEPAGAVVDGGAAAGCAGGGIGRGKGSEIHFTGRVSVCTVSGSSRSFR